MSRPKTAQELIHWLEEGAGSRWVALSELLPHVSGHLSESRQTTNLAAFGFSLPGVPPIIGLDG